MKLYISIDLEGFAGVTFWHEIMRNNNEYKNYQKIITKQINEVCKALKNRYSNLHKIVLCDSHADGANFIYEQLLSKVELVKGFPRRYYMMEGLDETYDGVVFLGYHVGIGNIGNMDHTYSSSKIYDIKINGKRMNEFLINSYFASDYNVPVILTMGGNHYLDEVRKINDDIETIETKKEFGKFSASFNNLEKIYRNINSTIKNMKEPGDYNVIDYQKPLKVEIDMVDTVFSEVSSLIPKVKRVSGRKIIYKPKDMREMYEILMTIIYVSKGVDKIN